MRGRLALTLVAFAALAAPGVASANVVTDWNRTMIDALEAAKTPPPPAARAAAIVQISVFDAVNGIARRYTPVHVQPASPRGASRDAAAVAAAHETLVALFPTQQAMLDQQLAASLAELGRGRSVARGLAWGKEVADQILAWRAGDGFDAVLPPYVSVNLPGRWQPTPPAFGPPLFRQFAEMTPFALVSPSQFLPAGPPPLTSARYARDFNEVKALGSLTSALRTPEETETAKFWQLDTPAAMWNRVADELADARGTSPVGEARILARMNVALADATIAIWNAKNVYDSWRPVTAIQSAASDGNPDTSPDPSWAPLLATPPFQEYPSAHSGVSSAATSVLADAYGNETSFRVLSAGLSGVERDFTSFPSAVAQVVDARIFAGFHFRSACDDAVRMGREVADYVDDTVAMRAHGDEDED
jgi:PAP2 superfamily